jgi:hypothetical protein
MSSTIIQANPAFNYTADLRPVAALPGTYNFTISSTFSGAKAPAPRTVFSAGLDRAGLLALRDLINAEVAQ